MKKIVSALLVVLLSLTLNVSAIAYDRTPGKFWEFEQAVVTESGQVFVNLNDSIVEILCIGTAYGAIWEGDRYTAYQGVFVQNGTGFLIEHGGKIYIITAAHVVTPNQVRIQVDTITLDTKSAIKPINTYIFFGGSHGSSAEARVVAISNEYDWAILVPTAPIKFGKPLKYKIVDTWYEEAGDQIHKGDAVGMMVRQRNENGEKLEYYEMRYGKIVSTSPYHPRTEILPWLSMADVTLDIKVYAGDSGSPVFGFINGKPVIIGIARAVAKVKENTEAEYSYMVRIDFVLEYFVVQGLL
jgi:hypothetical protein